MATALHPSAAPSTIVDHGPPTPVRAAPGASLLAACLVLGTVVLGGVVLGFEPAQNAVDSWGFSVFPAVAHSAFLRAVTDLGLAPVTAGISLVAAATIWRRDRRRTFACLAGPGLAVGLAELCKIVVGRKFQNALCWPSGTAAVVGAVVVAVVLCTRGKGRAAAVVIGSAVVILEVIALVAFRWHYLSDALGGVFLGVGSVLLVDALVHRIRRPARRRRPAPGDMTS
ncbi:MAG TPA: phosphatase PAP2 family protein [Acidimicrobiales bacterium]